MEDADEGMLARSLGSGRVERSSLCIIGNLIIVVLDNGEERSLEELNRIGNVQLRTLEELLSK